MEKVAGARRFRRAAFPPGLLPFSLFNRQATPFVTTLHGRLDLPEQQPVFDTFDVPVVSISDAQRRPHAAGEWVTTVHHGLPEKLLTPQPRRAEVSRVPRPDLARKSASTARSASRSVAACRSKSPPRSTRRTRNISNARSSRCSTATHVEFIGEIGDHAEGGIPERRARAAVSDRLARAVRPGDDRGDGVRHAGDRVQSRLGAGGDRRRR